MKIIREGKDTLCYIGYNKLHRIGLPTVNYYRWYCSWHFSGNRHRINGAQYVQFKLSHKKRFLYEKEIILNVENLVI